MTQAMVIHVTSLTHNRFRALWIFSVTTRVSRYQKKRLPTHTYRGHQSSLICFRHQFTCLTVFFPQSLSKFSLVYLLACHPHFTQSLSSFHSTCPYDHNLFCCSTEIMSSNPSLSLNPLLGTLSCAVTWRQTSIQPISSLPAEVPPHFPFHDRCEWVNVSSGTGSPRLSRTKSRAVKRLCVCICWSYLKI